MRGWLKFAAFAVAAMLVASSGFAEDEIYTPEAKPSPQTPSAPDKPAKRSAGGLGGVWILDTKGKTTCNPGVVVRFTSASSGTMQWGSLNGTFTVEVSGRTFRLVETYKDVFGNTTVETFSGTLSADRRSGSGTVSGGWGDGCTFVMAKQ